MSDSIYNSPIEFVAGYQLETGALDDLDLIFVIVSKEDWGKAPKKIPLRLILGGNVSSIHEESDSYQLTSTSIDVTFTTVFDAVPINTESIQVYKYIDGYRYNFLLKNLTVTTSKITATVEDVDPSYTFSDFSGIIFEYCLFERS